MTEEEQKKLTELTREDRELLWQCAYSKRAEYLRGSIGPETREKTRILTTVMQKLTLANMPDVSSLKLVEEKEGKAMAQVTTEEVPLGT